MKIKSLKIENFRSIKNELLIEDISDVVILTGENNSGKSSIINALAIFLLEKDIFPTDFHKGTHEVNISAIFSDICDDYLKNFTEYKKNISETNNLKNVYPSVFGSYTKNKIDKKEDIESLEQLEILESIWIENFKTSNYSNNSLEIKLSILKDGDKIKSQKYSLEKVGGIKIEKSNFLPNVIFIDDERNFTNEQDGKTGSITQKIFGGIEIKKKDDVLIEDLDRLVREEGKGIKDLDIHHLEKLLKQKANEKASEIGEKVTENFCKYYDNGYEIKVTPETTINHKTFSLSTSIKDPNIGETPLNNVGAGLRALYLLSLLKAYNSFQKNDNTIFIIEEPELYLHPGLQKKMGDVLNTISREQQLFLTTHSPIVLRKFNIEDVKDISKCSTENRTIKEDGDFNKILEKLGFSIFDIIKYKYLLFVEGRDDYSVIKKIIKKFYPDKIDEIEIITSNGCGNLKYYASLKFLGLLNRGDLNYLILRDRDNKDDITLNNEFETNLLSKDIDADFINELKSNFKILDRYSIENYFLDQDKVNSINSGFNITDFLSSFNLLEDSIKDNDSIKKGNESEFSRLITSIEADYDNSILKVRGHNIFNALIYYMNGNEKRYVYDNNKKDEYIDNYIDSSEKSDFGVLTQYLDELFGLTN